MISNTTSGNLSPKVSPRKRKDPPPEPGKGPVTCGAPLRNRTVDLLLTMQANYVRLYPAVSYCYRSRTVCRPRTSLLPPGG
jgi:hypothetical protein